MTIFNITTEQPLAANTESPLLVKASFGNTRYGTSQRPKQWRCNEMAIHPQHVKILHHSIHLTGAEYGSTREVVYLVYF